MTKLEWGKAKSKPAPKPRDNRTAEMRRQTAMANYVAKHDLACFKCGTREGEWANAGLNRRGRWAICVNCVRG